MKIKYEITALQRIYLGKSANRKIRRIYNRIPAIIYGNNKKNLPISIETNLLNNIIEYKYFLNSIIKINIKNNIETVLVLFIQYHSIKTFILHIDFIRITENTQLKLNIPFKFINIDTCKGIKEGGIIKILKKNIEITCFPKYIIYYLEININNLNLGENIKITDIKLPKGVNLIKKQDNIIITIINKKKIDKID
ncbi:50S ribosomal protein L25 [Candidatus Johnevansia muelleri]|uniref:Large ribosomal subunit protein bL25 n=1 Tax=Candidatus Johnevansia muelleri TaxID=1495769 RepID=A0A078KIH7_9GAMM|nr:50S ribosomal protein L25 [Candidatus Evansia muelleri]